MKKLFHVFLAVLMMGCLSAYAEETVQTFQVPDSFVSGKATYDEVLNWSKQKIASDAKQSGLENALNGFPVILNEQCGRMKLIFVKNTADCGVINCGYFMFRKSSSSKKATYKYIDNIDFAAVRLLCYPNDDGYTYYLFTSLQESNAAGSLQLGEISDDQYKQTSSVNVDYTNQKMRELVDTYWEEFPSEEKLLDLFKKS